MSHSFRERLMTALRDATDAFNSGGTPTDAVVKSASVNGFNQDQTRRLCESFNTARTIYQFSKMPDKTASFELADADAALLRLFKAAAPAQKKVASPIDLDEYLQPETDYRHGEWVAMDKVAAARADAALGIEVVTEEDVVGTELMGYKVASQAASYQDGAEHAQDESDCAYEAANRAFAKLARDLSLTYRDEGTDLYTRLLRSVLDSKDEAYHPILEKLATYMPSYMTVTTQDLIKIGRVVDDQDLADYRETLEAGRRCLESGARLKAVSVTMSKMAREIQAKFQASLNLPKPDPADPFAGILVKRAQEAKPASKPSKGGADPFGMIPSIIASGVGGSATKQLGAATDELFAGDLAKENRRRSDEMGNIRRSAILQDLVSNDQVLSDSDPKSVADAYAAIVQIAPEASMNREIMRAVLRQAVHASALSPFDAQQLVELETKLRTVNGTLPSKPGTKVT